MMKRKPALSPEEKLKVAWYHLGRGVEQQFLAEYEGVNIGRVNEACKTAEKAFGIKSKVKIAVQNTNVVPMR